MQGEVCNQGLPQPTKEDWNAEAQEMDFSLSWHLHNLIREAVSSGNKEEKIIAFGHGCDRDYGIVDRVPRSNIGHTATLFEIGEQSVRAFLEPGTTF